MFIRAIASFIFLELSLYAAVSFAAMKSTLPAELMLESVSLLKSGGGDAGGSEYGGRRQTEEFPLVTGEAETDGVEFPLTVADNMENIMRASIQNYNNNAQNDNDEGGVDELELQNKHNAHFNIADKLLQQQQQRQQKQEENLFPMWLQQMHKDPSEQQHQQHQQQLREYNHNNNKAFPNAQQEHKHSLPHAGSPRAHPPALHESQSSASAPASMAEPTTSHHCSIEISTNIPGRCQPMAPIGSACISGDYMEVYGSLDCM